MITPSHAWRLAVVGGGISGLAAAHRLRCLLPAAELRVFEAGPRLGGALHTLSSGAMLVELGADSFTTKSPAALALCRELGLAKELLSTNPQHRRAAVVRGGKLYPVPDGFVLMQPRRWGPLLKSPVLSLAGKLRALAEPWIRPRAATGVMNYDESVASFATRRLGARRSSGWWSRSWQEFTWPMPIGSASPPRCRNFSKPNAATEVCTARRAGQAPTPTASRRPPRRLAQRAPVTNPS